MATSWSGPALADGLVTQPVTACVDPRATYVLTDPQRLAHHGAGWRASVELHGRCFAIQPGEYWERILSVGGLVLMRRTPPQAGVPPLYFRADAAPAVASGLYSPGIPQSPEVVAPEVVAPEVVATALPALPPPFQAPPVQPAPAPAQLPAIQPDVQDVGDATTAVRTEDLPPLPLPASRVPPAGVVEAPPPAPPLPAAPVVAVPAGPALPATTAAPPPAPLPGPDVSPASTRGYAIGFTLVIVLIAVLLAAMALLLRFLLHGSPNAEPAPPRPADTLREAMLSPTSRPRNRRPSRKSRPTPQRPERREPVVATIRPDPQPVTRRPASVPVAPAMLEAAGTRPGSGPWLSEDGTDIQRQCAEMLREAGWDARIRSRIGQRHGDVVARRNGRTMALRCLPDTALVDEQAVEEVCMAREREQADVAVIVSNGVVTKAARHLALQTGVDLLHEDAFRRFAG